MFTGFKASPAGHSTSGRCPLNLACHTSIQCWSCVTIPGKKVAESDDVVAGQGTVIGNPDSSLFYTPQEDGPLFLTVFDRLNRGGPGL